MLDATELARRLREAMDKRDARITSAALALECKVTDQAVNGWRKTGRIAKKHLPTIARVTGKPLHYFLGQDAAGVSTNYGLVLGIEEAEAITRLRERHPDWRRYVLGLAMMESGQADLMLRTMRQAVPDYKVEAAVGTAPHVAKAKAKAK